MKLLLVVAYFVPEIGSAAHIYFDLAKAFVRRGHEVHVITSYPRSFNLSITDSKLDFPLEEFIDGIQVHRCKHRAPRDNIIMRGMEHFILPCFYFISYLRLKKKFDGCLIYIPPLPLHYFARAIKIFDGTPSVMNYQDFHPQELTDVGLLKNGLLIKIMEYIERQSYKKADYIAVLSEGGIDYIVRRGGDSSKIDHIYNSSLVTPQDGTQKEPDFKKKEKIEDKILITYAGILSPFQGLDNILNAAKELKEHKDLIFYLVGDGLIKDHLAQRIMAEHISNVRLLSLQPRDEYLNITNSSDISLISLDDRMKAPCIPGKMLNLMAGKKPMIAVVPNDCETAKIIKSSKSGIVVIPGDSEKLKNTILRLKNRPYLLKKLGENGRRFFEKNMSIDENILIYEKIFKRSIKK